jgi:hypothetical protein
MLLPSWKAWVHMTPARQRELKSLQIEYAIDILKWLTECLAGVKRYVKPDE